MSTYQGKIQYKISRDVFTNLVYNFRKNNWACQFVTNIIRAHLELSWMIESLKPHIRLTSHKK